MCYSPCVFLCSNSSICHCVKLFVCLHTPAYMCTGMCLVFFPPNIIHLPRTLPGEDRVLVICQWGLLSAVWCLVQSWQSSLPWAILSICLSCTHTHHYMICRFSLDQALMPKYHGVTSQTWHARKPAPYVSLNVDKARKQCQIRTEVKS